MKMLLVVIIEIFAFLEPVDPLLVYFDQLTLLLGPLLKHLIQFPLLAHLQTYFLMLLFQLQFSLCLL